MCRIRYGTTLFGRAIGDERVEQLGLLLLATELRGAWTYYQISDDEIYPKPLRRDRQCAHTARTACSAPNSPRIHAARAHHCTRARGVSATAKLSST